MVTEEGKAFVQSGEGETGVLRGSRHDSLDVPRAFAWVTDGQATARHPRMRAAPMLREYAQPLGGMIR
jgi:hypothetical protein